jgi:hypothetical protein
MLSDAITAQNAADPKAAEQALRCLSCDRPSSRLQCATCLEMKLREWAAELRTQEAGRTK